MKSEKGVLSFTFEYEAYAKTDPGYVECQIHYDLTPATPETGRRYMGDPAKYDPGSPHEVEYLHAEREVERNGKKVFERLKTGEFLDEQCQLYLESRDEDDLLSGLPNGGEPDPDRMREDAHERRMLERD